MRPGAPGLPLADVRSVIADPASELPVLRAPFLVYMLPPLPRRSGWAYYFAGSPSC